MANQNLTTEELEQLKQKHGKIKLFTVEEREVAFRQPTRAEMNVVNQKLAKDKNVSAYTDTILNTCQLNYQEETAENVELYMALAAVTDQIVTTLSASLKN